MSHEHAKHIRLLILDVDGILTTGTVQYGTQGAELKGFHLHDGMGIKLLQKAGIAVAVISAKKSAAVSHRLKDLNVEHVYLGYENKLPAYIELKQKLNIADDVIAYMGDDLPDLPILRRVKLAITVPQAPDIIKQHTHLITTKKGGKGAVREVCDMLMEAQGLYQQMIQAYLTE